MSFGSQLRYWLLAEQVVLLANSALTPVGAPAEQIMLLAIGRASCAIAPDKQYLHTRRVSSCVIYSMDVNGLRLDVHAQYLL